MTRRDVMMMLPALGAAQAAHAEQAATGPQPPAQGPQTAPLPAKVYHSAEIPHKGDATKRGRRFFYGLEHTGFALECHETVLGPGIETHPPHSHAHEEVIVVVEGTIEVSTPEPGG